MSKFKKFILEAVIDYALLESEAKVDFLIKNKKVETALKNTIKEDPEIENKNITPKELLLSWDEQFPIVSKNIIWIAKQYSQGLFHNGDIPRIADDLIKFEKYRKNKNLFDSPDINKYNYSDLKQKLDTINDEDVSQLGSSARKSTIEKSKDEIEKIYEDNKWLIISPKTEAAARYWGKGTYWCTAADSRFNMFDHYAKNGPLYILINKNNPEEKYQFHFETHQFMDKNDTFMDLSSFLKDNPQIKKVFKKRINSYDKEDYHNWVWLNTNEISPKMCLGAIRKTNGNALQHIPDELKTPEICLQAIQRNGNALQYVPEKLKTKEMCLVAVQNNGNALQYIPENLKTKDICLVAVQTNGYALEYVPENLKTKEICLAAIQKDERALGYLPEKLKTKEMYLTAIKTNGHAILFVPDKFKTKDTYLIAVQKDGNVLKQIPENLKTEDICLKAVEQNPNALYYVPNEFKTDCLDKIFEKINEQYEISSAKNKELANKSKEININFDTSSILSKLKSVKKQPSAEKLDTNSIHFLHDSLPWWFKDNKAELNEAIKKLITKNGSLIQYLPNKLRTYDLSLLAAQHSNEIQDQLKSDELDFNKDHSDSDIALKSIIPFRFLKEMRYRIDNNIPLDFKDLPGEVWKYIPGDYPSFEISNKGRVRSKSYTNELNWDPDIDKMPYRLLSKNDSNIVNLYNVTTHKMEPVNRFEIMKKVFDKPTTAKESKTTKSLQEIRAQMQRLVEDINNGTTTIYLIVDRYENAEFYDIFGKGIYTDLQQAQKDYKKELQQFKAIGPDDCHTFSLYQCDLDNQDMQELEDHYKHYIAHPEDNYNEDFTAFMERICRNNGKQLLFWTI